MLTGRMFVIFGAMLSAMLLGPVSAAQAGDTETLGDVINNVTMSLGGAQNILSAIAWLAGAFLGVAGIFKFKDHVDNPHQTPLSAGVKRMIAGGMFLALPFMISVVIGSVLGDAGEGAYGFTVNWGLDSGALSDNGMDRVIVEFITNIHGPINILLVAFCYLAGIALLMVGISRLTKRMEEGPRGPAGMGTIMTFVVSGVLISFGDSVGVFVSSLFGDNELMNDATINASVIVNETDRERIEAVIEAVMAFVMIVGYIAFIRGWFVLKAFADGAQGATLAQGLTFVLGGTLAINLGELVNVLQATVGVEGLTFG